MQNRGCKIMLVSNYRRDPSKVLALFKAVGKVSGSAPMVVWYRELAHYDVDRFDAVILSGSESMLSQTPDQTEYASIMATIRSCRKPVLGICFGHQLIGAAFGGMVIHLSQRLEGFRVASLIDEDEIFDGMPSSFRAAESHSEAVSSVMPGFVHLAKSEDCEVEAFRHKSRPIYGVQFHPENSDRDNPVGLTVLSNFVKIARKDQ